MRRSQLLLKTAVPVIGASAALAAAAAPALAAPPTSPTATPSITAGPAEGSHVASTSATFKFSDKTAKSTFTCKLDSGTAAACTSPKTYTGLAQGKHTFTVVAQAPNRPASSPTTRSWVVDTIAPKPAIAAPTALNTPVVVAFGEAVRAAKSPLASLTLTDTAAAVPAAVTCWSGSTSVACASATFDTVRVKPNANLVSGQHYTANVAAAVVKDLAGNANTAATKAFRGARSLQENAPGITTAWQSVKASSAAGGSYVREHLAGATASWSFTGTSVTWSTVTGPAQGKADVYVDGVRKTTVNNYAASTHYNVARTISGLTNSSHRLRIVVLGLKGAKAGKGTFVAIDAFTVGSTTTTSPTLATTWRRLSSSHFSGGHAIVADLRGSTLKLTFRGTGVTWYTQRGPTQGKAQIWIDNTLKATVDDYATTTSYGVKRAIGKLSDKLHTLKIVVLGQHHTGGKGNLVTVDRFAVA